MCCSFKAYIKVLGNLTIRLISLTYNCICCFNCCWNKKRRCYSESRNPIEISATDSQISDEDCFKNINRATAEYLLENRQGGTFIIRPSKFSKHGVLSVVQDGKIFHLIIRERDDQKMALGYEKRDERTFRNLDHLINYYVSNYLILSVSDEESAKTLLLPYRESKEKVVMETIM